MSTTPDPLTAVLEEASLETDSVTAVTHEIATEIILVTGNTLATLAELPGIHLPFLPVNSAITMRSTRYQVARVPDIAIASPGAATANLVTLKIYVSDPE